VLPSLGLDRLPSPMLVGCLPLLEAPDARVGQPFVWIAASGL
jgi:hypothetical protein